MENIDLVLFDSESEMDALKEKFEEYSGEALSDGDERDAVLKCILYAEECLMNKINAEANNNLVMFCDETRLLYYGAERDTYRLEAESASCHVGFTASALAPDPVEIPAGTRVTADGKQFFATQEDMTLEPGETRAALCVATVPGAAGNGYQPGQIDTLANTIPYVESVANTDASGGGSDQESLEEFRDNVLYAPLKFNTTGSVGGYIYKTRGVSSSIADVDVEADGAEISVYVLCEGGELPSEELLREVQEYLDQPTVRAATDHVTALPAVRVPYSARVTYRVLERDYARLSAICEAVEEAVSEYVDGAACRMGTAINPEMLGAAAYSAGAASVTVEAPSEYRRLEDWEAPHCESLEVLFDGLLGG